MGSLPISEHLVKVGYQRAQLGTLEEEPPLECAASVPWAEVFGDWGGETLGLGFAVTNRSFKARSLC